MKKFFKVSMILWVLILDVMNFYHLLFENLSQVCKQNTGLNDCFQTYVSVKVMVIVKEIIVTYFSTKHDSLHIQAWHKIYADNYSGQFYKNPTENIDIFFTNLIWWLGFDSTWPILEFQLDVNKVISWTSFTKIFMKYGHNLTSQRLTLTHWMSQKCHPQSV